MLDSDLITPLHQDLGNPIPDTVKGAVTLIGGLFIVVGLLNGALLIPLLLVVVGYVVFTWRENVEIDFRSRHYTKRQGPYGFRRGKTRAFGTPEFISIREKLKRDGGQFVLMKSATSIKQTIALLAFEETDNLLLVMQGQHAYSIMEQAQLIASYFNIPLEDDRG